MSIQNNSLTNKQVLEILSKMHPSQLDDKFVTKNIYGEHYLVDGSETKEIQYFYNKKDISGKCYTALQLEQMGVPKENWEPDFVKSVIHFKIEKL